MSQYEQSVLASVIADPTLLDRIELNGSDFLDDELGSLFAKLRTAHAAGVPLRDSAAMAGILRGSPVNVADVCGHDFEAKHGTFYAEQIRQASRLRTIAIISEEAVAKTRTTNADPDQVTEWLSAQLAGLGSRTPHRGMTLSDSLREIADAADAKDAGSLPIGISQIDTFCGGWRPGELIIVGARTGVGKSIFHLQSAREQAHQQHKVLIASVEMSRGELASRTVTSMTDIQSNWIRSGGLSDRQINKIRQLATNLDDLDVTLWDPPTATVRQLQAFARCHQAERGLDILHVDYLQRVRPSGREKDRREAVDAMAQGLKTIARELGILVVASCQLSRAGEGDPKLSHLRESGAIEQEADGVILISRDDEDVTADVAKNRHGPCGEIRLRFNKRTLTFEGEPAEQCRNYEPAFN